MPNRVVQRSAALAACLSLLVSPAVFADVVIGDGDTVEAGSQTFLELGEVSPGEEVAFDVWFDLVCRNGSHAERGSSIEISLGSATVSADMEVAAEPGLIGPVPADWPLAPEFCSGSPTLRSATPARVTLTAPTTPGDDYPFTLVFFKSPSTGTTGFTSVTGVIDVAEDTVDTSPPTLAGVPGNQTVTTSASSVVVSWPAPTATDDVDPSPDVACSPASGSSFPLGATPVTCAATDDAGNRATAGFTVTVVRATAVFDQPVGNAGTFTVASSRTIPIKVQLIRDGTPVTSGDSWIWLGRCGEPSAKVAGLERQSDRWQAHLDTSGLGPGCYQVTVRANGVTFGGFELRVEGSATTTALSKPRKKG